METTQAELELSVIKKIMEDSRKITVESGKQLILWGAVVSAALVANYIMVIMKISTNYQGLMWFILMTGTWLAGWIMERSENKKRKVHTFAGKLLGSLWFASGISMFMLGFIGTASRAYNPVYICPLISVILGISYFTSGTIQQISWLRNIAIAWWLAAILLFIFPGAHTLLIFAGMLIVFQLTPGLIFYKKWKKESA